MQEITIPVDVDAAVAIPYSAAATTAVSGLFYCCSSVAAIMAVAMDADAVILCSAATTAAVNGLSGLSFSPASAAATTAVAATMAAVNCI